MALVLVVGVTRMKRAVCVGGWDLERQRAVRLLRADGRHHLPEEGFEVGQVWEMDLQPVEALVPPHTEDHRVLRRRFVRRTADVAEQILAYMEPKTVSLREMFNGALTLTTNGSAFVDDRCVPGHSTDFWLADRDLVFTGDRVQCPDPWRPVSVSYVGMEKRPAGIIPIGSLVRLSLARWWEPEGAMTGERCYLQVSGWWQLNRESCQAMLG